MTRRRRLAALSAIVLAAPLVLAATGAARAADVPPPAPPLPLGQCAPYAGGTTICSGSVPSFDGSPLDFDVTLPTDNSPGPHPLIVMLHGFGNNKHEWESTTDEGDGADKYQWNSHWLARHGYYVLTYTARGFRSKAASEPYQPDTPGGTSVGPPAGTIHIKSRNWEVRDTQWLAALVAATFGDVDPSRVAVTGG